MFSENSEFSYVSGLDGVLFEIEGRNAGNDEVEVTVTRDANDDNVLCSLDYSELCEDIVHRGMTLVYEYNSAQAAVDQTLATTSLSHRTFPLSCTHAFAAETGRQLSLAAFKRVPCEPRIVPPILTHQSFDVAADLQTVRETIKDFLLHQPGMVASFVDSDFVWNCKQICGFSEHLTFDVRIYRYACSHAKSGILAIEMQRYSGERMRYFNIYDAIRQLFCEHSLKSGICDCCGFEVADMPEPGGEESPSNPLGEIEVKQALLSVLTSDKADYKTLLETVQLAGTIFSGFRLSTLDVQIFYALEHLCANHPQFYWLQPFVAEKRQALLTEPSLSFAGAVPVNSSSFEVRVR